VAFTGAFVANGVGLLAGPQECLLHRSAQHAPFSAIRTIALGLPVTSSTVCHPTDGRRRIRAERSATQDGERQKQSHRAVRPQ
jgi:hypothetical protein